MTSKQKVEFAILAIDNVVFRLIDGRLEVLLVESKNPEFAGSKALIGGLVEPSEDIDEAALRYFKNFVEVNKKSMHMEQLYTFGDPKRDPSGRVVSVAYMALVPPRKLKIKTTSEYKDIKWHPVRNLPEMAYDHKEIVGAALTRLKAKIEYTNIIHGLMSELFTLTDLQDAYEVILNQKLDKRNFRKKIHSLGIIEETSKKRVGEPHRPAKLYRFSTKKPMVVEVL